MFLDRKDESGVSGSDQWHDGDVSKWCGGRPEVRVVGDWKAGQSVVPERMGRRQPCRTGGERETHGVWVTDVEVEGMERVEFGGRQEVRRQRSGMSRGKRMRRKGLTRLRLEASPR